MTAELEYNARSIPPAEIARSFIPPGPHFSRLLSRNHTLLLGPRGSGKTSLLKMLTGQALNNWDHPQARELASQVAFNAAFVSADVTWGKQLESLDELNFGPTKREAAFVTHTLRALIYSMREAAELSRGPLKPHISHLAIDLNQAQEERFVTLVSGDLRITPRLNTLLGLEIALQSKLNSINLGDSDDVFSVEAFPSKLSLLISAFNGIIGQDSRRWALLFDELEIAPTWIKSFLLSGIRSFDERVIVKLALVPYMENVGFERTPMSPQPYHDYQTIQLTYPNKDDALQFSSELFINTFARVGVRTDSLPRLFGNPMGRGELKRGANQRRSIPVEFEELAAKDDSFRRYVDERGIFSHNYSFTENNIAQDIRKVLPIVTARNFYLRRFENGRVVAERSRKSQSLFIGFPSIVEVTEGNPRAILTCVGPLTQQYKELISESDSNRTVPIPHWIQNQAIRRVELLLTSLLQVIPIDIGGFETAKGLLAFVDQIGRAFQDRLLKGPFVTDYVGTFILDQNVTPQVVGAVGKALNAGAIIHVPAPDSGPDILLRGLVGQRFRLSYALASRYRLLITLGDRVSLSRLLLEMRGVNIENTQRTFFESEEND